jgi:hypothetical protein
MKNKVLISTILMLLLITMMAYFAFDLHHFLPVRIQWLYGVTMITMLLILFLAMERLFYKKTKSPILKSHLFSGIWSFFAMLILMIGVCQITLIRTESVVNHFLQQHEGRLREVVESIKFDHGDTARVHDILDDLNVRLATGRDGSYHFELYRFLGYGYRILFTQNPQMDKPMSPGGSPTVTCYHLKENWFYYSYFD